MADEPSLDESAPLAPRAADLGADAVSKIVGQPVCQCPFHRRARDEPPKPAEIFEIYQ